MPFFSRKNSLIAEPAPRRRFSAALTALALWVLLGASSAAATTVDIMYVYDSGAVNWVASNGGMQVFSQQITSRMNQAMQNSGVDLTFRVVHSMSVDYATPTLDNSGTLSALQGGTGAFAPVHAARDTFGADVVAMLCQPTSASSTAGWAYTLSSWGGRQAFAFSINNIIYANSHYSLTHEVGHNFGAHHAKAQTSSPGPNTSLTNPTAPYSAGWYFTGTNGVKYNTIMAYWFDGLGNTYQQAPIFSSPLLTHQGAVAGHAVDGDNARLLRETMAVVASYRATVDPRTLTVAVTGATGVAMSSSPAGYEGEAPYSVADIAPDTTLTLTAPATAGDAQFDSWSGCDSVNGRECTVQMDEDRTVQAVYTPVSRALQVGVQGVPEALVESSPMGYGGAAPYVVDDVSHGTVVTLTAPQSVGITPFAGWDGCDASLGRECTVVMNADKSVTARYGTGVRLQEIYYLLLLDE
jgi:hypothetical protein